MASYLTPLTLRRGVHQGCPHSMLFYIIAAEVLANFIITNRTVKVVQIGDQEIIIVNFADDTTIFFGDIDGSSSKINPTKKPGLMVRWL